ncbi:MAG: DoxX family protein [Candidatus Rokubacteria bacterium]|nr:DoxX family protein [Candidatus Rokubacteria bacterium]
MSPLGATVLRIMLGVTFIAHGYYIYDVVTSDVLSVMINKRLGLPLGDYVTSYILLAHFVGGVMLILGVFTRIAAMANLPIMIGAVLLFHFDQGFFLRGVIIDAARGKADVVGYEYALFVLAATLAQCFLGTGAIGLTKS